MRYSCAICLFILCLDTYTKSRDRGANRDENYLSIGSESKMQKNIKLEQNDIW